MRERNDELDARSDVRIAHHRLVVVRARMSFGVFNLFRDKDEDERHLLQDVRMLLRAAGEQYWIAPSRGSEREGGRKRSAKQRREEKLIEVERFTDEALEVISRKIRTGECYAFYPPFLEQALKLRLLGEERDKKRTKGFPEDVEEVDGQDEGRLSVPEEMKTSFLELYQQLRERLVAEQPLGDMLDRYVATVKGPWAPEMAREEFEREGGKKTLKYLESLYQRLRRELFERIHEAFDEWISIWAKKLNQRVERRLPRHTAQQVVELIRQLAPSSADTSPATEGHSTDGLSFRPTDKDLERQSWIRGRQRDFMFKRADWEKDRPSLRALLREYADLACRTKAEILERVYTGISAEEAKRQWDADLDILHQWYEVITREALHIRKAWRFYDRIPHLGPGGELTRKAGNQPDFARRFGPILKKASIPMRFLQLPDELGITLEELADRVLQLRALVAHRGDAEEPRHAPRGISHD